MNQSKHTPGFLTTTLSRSRTWRMLSYNKQHYASSENILLSYTIIQFSAPLYFRTLWRYGNCIIIITPRTPFIVVTQPEK